MVLNVLSQLFLCLSFSWFLFAWHGIAWRCMIGFLMARVEKDLRKQGNEEGRQEGKKEGVMRLFSGYTHIVAFWMVLVGSVLVLLVLVSLPVRQSTVASVYGIYIYFCVCLSGMCILGVVGCLEEDCARIGDG
ncbi:hypothetical protein ACMFMG_007275 [Clarireedia jacksonii]